MKNLFGVKPLKDKVQYWIDIAQYDIDTADAMLQTKRYLYVGFMCHQAVEKTLKAYYVFNTEGNAPRTHNLTLLARESNLYEEFSEEQKDFLDVLEPLNVEARYPTDKERIMKSLDLKKCAEILTNTKELVEWIRTRLFQ